jgi:CBS domain-containing protein
MPFYLPSCAAAQAQNVRLPVVPTNVKTRPVGARLPGRSVESSSKKRTHDGVHKIKRLPVVDAEGRMVGLVGCGAIVQALATDFPGD